MKKKKNKKERAALLQKEIYKDACLWTRVAAAAFVEDSVHHKREQQHDNNAIKNPKREKKCNLSLPR